MSAAATVDVCSCSAHAMPIHRIVSSEATRPGVILAVLLALLAINLTTRAHTVAGSGVLAGHMKLTPAQRAGALSFAPQTNPVDMQVVRDAIAGARPDARRLIDAVDGAVTIIVGPTGRGTAVGMTQQTAAGFEVTLDLGTVSSAAGERGIVRMVLHEMGHVVDHALVPPAMRAQLDAGIPPGYPCTEVTDPACAGRSAREERFAESFAKWATEDIGIGLSLGYSVLPPYDLTGWGAPLIGLL